jgi:hypothetical protein
MARPAENPVPEAETCFRGLEAGWFNVTDDAVLHTAIDSRGSSVYRSKYANAQFALDHRAEHLAVADTSGERLKAPVSYAVDPTTQAVILVEPEHERALTLIAYVWDDPAEGEFHAEVRLRRPDDEPGTHKKPGAAVRLIVFEQLARRLRLLKEPRR